MFRPFIRPVTGTGWKYIKEHCAIMLFHCNNGYASAPQYYVIRIASALLHYIRCVWLSHVNRSCAFRRSKSEVTLNNALYELYTFKVLPGNLLGGTTVNVRVVLRTKHKRLSFHIAGAMKKQTITLASSSENFGFIYQAVRLIQQDSTQWEIRRLLANESTCSTLFCRTIVHAFRNWRGI
jgi:hypothetical protein